MEGLVIKNTGSWYIVHTDEGSDVNCKVKGNFRLKGIRTTNPIAVGDKVTITVNPDGNAYITARRPRENYIIRRASNLSKESHIIAANVDRAFLVVTLSHPVTSTTFIDRFLATAEAYRIPVTIVINKTDLLTEPEEHEYCEAVTYLYRSIGYDVIEISAKEGTGIENLRNRLVGKVSLLSGNSGVGKSTIINDLMPELDLRTAAISDIHDTGMHEIAHFFPEIFNISCNCRYSDCTHTHEPGCAVLEALADHRIAESRYNSYLSILDDTNPDKYRKPF